MQYIYTGKHPIYCGRRVPCGMLIEDPESNRLLGAHNLRALLQAGVAEEISDAEADKIRAALKKKADEDKAREAPAAKPEPKPEPKPPGGDK